MTCCEMPLILVPVAVLERRTISFQLQPRQFTCLSQPPAVGALPSDQGGVRIKETESTSLLGRWSTAKTQD